MAARFYLSFSCSLPSCSASLPVGAQSPRPAADTVIVNARIYTVNARQPWAEALAIREDKILAVGSAKDIAAYRGTSTKVIDAHGKLVLPGFTDCHIHFMEGSLGLTHVDLNGAQVRGRDPKASEGIRRMPILSRNGLRAWVGLIPLSVPPRLPDKKFLDEVVPDRPVYSAGLRWPQLVGKQQGAGAGRDNPGNSRSSARQDCSRRQRAKPPAH